VTSGLDDGVVGASAPATPTSAPAPNPATSASTPASNPSTSASAAAPSPGASASAPALPPTTAYAVRARGLRKVFGRTVAVDSVDLDVPAGAVLGVLGPNGSGKTTVIRMLLGLCQPTAGAITLLGATMPDEAAAVLPRVGALVEGPGFHPFLSGRENLLRAAAFEPLVPARRAPAIVDEALERVGLADAARRAYRGYSLGMKQRLGLAAALLVPRELVVLDEPTNGLDPAGTMQVRRIIAELRAAGSTVLVSSHLLAEVETTCTHVAVLQAGVVIAQGELSTLLEGDQPMLDVTTAEVDLALATLRAAGIPARPSRAGVEAELTVLPSDELIALLVKAGVPVTEARRRRTGLEELFAALTEEDA
jgi:ABC-2 type transport system ATP-binding protein